MSTPIGAIVLTVKQLDDLTRKISSFTHRRLNSASRSLRDADGTFSTLDRTFRVKIGDKTYIAVDRNIRHVKRDDEIRFKEPTGRTTPGSHKEKAAMGWVQDYPEYGEVLRNVTLRDPRWPATDGWVKMSQTVDDTEIHYVYNPATREAADYKFKDRTEQIKT
ncbi:hypothetical protein [Nocardia sp. NBC_00416]|uniref:hypothetical protein n=1 Tax=Nocardia sp. NBC_00416 TaxID=2975991 RepID=UPI002E24DD75